MDYKEATFNYIEYIKNRGKATKAHINYELTKEISDIEKIQKLMFIILNYKKEIDEAMYDYFKNIIYSCFRDISSKETENKE